MIISIAIADSNRDYVERLTEVLQQKGDLNISIFTNADRLMSSMERERYDVVLFDPDISDDKLYFSNVKLAICLYSDEAMNKDLYSDIENIRKYQRISNIYKSILKKYADKAGYSADFGNAKRTKLEAVYSPIGGSGKTVISMAMAGKLTELGRNVLYISTEQLSSSAAFFQYQEEGNTALVETLGSGASFDMKLKGIAKQGNNGVNYVEGFERIADYSDVTYQEMKDVLSNIKKTGIYDNVIVDMGSNIDHISKAVWEEADEIVVICKSGNFATQKLNFFANQGMVLENKNKFLKIENMADNSSRFNNDFNVPCVATVHNYGNISEEQVISAINYNKEIDVTKFF